MDLITSAQLLGNLGELFGAIGVVVTLVYLAAQVRLSREATEANTRQMRTTAAMESQDILANFNGQMAAHPAFVEIIYKATSARSMSQLSEVDAMHAAAVFRTVAQLFESIYFRYESGLLDERIWQLRRRWLAGWLQIPTIAEWWSLEREGSAFTSEFIAEIESADPAQVGATGLSDGH